MKESIISDIKKRREMNEEEINEIIEIRNNLHKLISKYLKHSGEKWFSHLLQSAGYLDTCIVLLQNGSKVNERMFE